MLSVVSLPGAPPQELHSTPAASRFSLARLGLVLAPKKGKGSPYSIAERRIPELISQVT